MCISRFTGPILSHQCLKSMTLRFIMGRAVVVEAEPALLERTQEVVKIVQGAQEVAQVQHPKTQVTGIQIGFNQPEPNFLTFDK